MKKIVRDQKGFGGMELILVLVLIALIGAGGWYVYKNRQNDNTPPAASESSEQAEQESSPEEEDESDNWLEFTSAQDTYRLRIPDGWHLIHQTDADLLYAEEAADLEYAVGSEVLIEERTGGRDGTLPFVVAYEEAGMRTFEGYESQGAASAAGLEGTRYRREVTEDPEIMGPPKGSIEYGYYFEQDGNALYVGYTILPDAVDRTSLVEQVIATLEFM